MTMDFYIDAEKIALSSQTAAFKTESFIAETRRIVAIDVFISRIADGILREGAALREGCYSVQTADGPYTFFVYRHAGNAENALIFYKFLSANSNEGGVDRGLEDKLASQKPIKLILRDATEKIDKEDLLKLYLVSIADGAVNFPRLNDNQRKIVDTEDANILVQGVAGSGKTNVCVEKIVRCACRNYRGKVLYTTFSRGLLSETRNKVKAFLKSIDEFVEKYEEGNVVFLDADHKKAVENKLGILFSVDADGEIVASLKRISVFLREKVEYLLIEDIYSRYFPPKPIATESTFINEYVGDGKSCRSYGALEKIKNISLEIVYKEIYGMIFGKYELASPTDMMKRDEYVEARRDSFTPRECETIYSVAVDYADFLRRRGYTDNNFMSREALGKVASPEYSVGVIDEVQDFTQVNLCLIKKLCRKMFCVGDALQMINPSYFNFGYVKRLMYGDATGVSELKHNYRSTARIEKIAQKLGDMNIGKFGTHSFVLRGESVSSADEGSAAFVKSGGLALSLGQKAFENLTVIVASQKKKDALKKVLGKTEVLTVAEAKGLERDAVVLVDVLSDNIDKWRYLENVALNRKTADENSVFRYYFNLFYVGISRAKRYLVVSETEYPRSFDKFFDECFERRSKSSALALLKDIAGTMDIDDDEFVDRIEKFCFLEQYDNALATADRLSSGELRSKMTAYIGVHEKYLRYGNFRGAGVEYWRRGMDREAREMFVRSGDEKLFPLMDACMQGGSSALDPEIVRFYALVEDNDLAKNIILETLDKDSQDLSAAFKEATLKMRRKK